MGGNAGMRGKILTLPAWEQYQFRYALISDYREERGYRNIVAQDLQPLWRALPESDYTSTFSLNEDDEAEVEPMPLALWECEMKQFHGDDNPRLKSYLDAVRRVVKERMRLTTNGEVAGWAEEFVHADVTAGKYGPFDPSVSMNYRTFEATIRLAVSPARASVRLTVPYDPASEGRESTGREHEFGGWNVEPGRWFGFDGWAELEQCTFNLYQEWVADLRRYWEKHYQHRYAGTLAQKREDITRIFRYLFLREMTDIVDRATRLRMQRMATAIEIDLPDLAQKHPAK